MMIDSTEFFAMLKKTGIFGGMNTDGVTRLQITLEVNQPAKFVIESDAQRTHANGIIETLQGEFVLHRKNEHIET